MVFESEKIMFEIYKDTLYDKNFRVVYYTELNEHNKHQEINRAQAGEYFFDGFIREFEKDKAKELITKIVKDLNDGKILTKEQITEILKEYTP
jgi:hypothetical protein